MIAIITAETHIILATLLQTMTIQCASRIVVIHNVARQIITVTTGAMNYLATLILNAPPDAATSMANVPATIHNAGRVHHVQTTLGMEGAVTTAAVTKRPYSAPTTIPDASPTRLIHQVKVVLTIAAATAALTLFGSGFCSRYALLCQLSPSWSRGSVSKLQMPL